MSDKVKHLKENEFEAEVIKSDKPVVVDFWAPWCGPCRMIEPVVEELAEDYENVKFVKVNTDESRSIAIKYGIMGIPTLKIFKDGNVVDSMSGAAPKEYFQEWIDKALA
jgi:thioredoxin 1